MAAFEEFTDPRLVALYDQWGPDRADTAFYVGLAAELAAGSVVDLGCGTGVLACELARRGHQVTGIDPSPAMLEVARGRPGGELVRWVEGDAGRLGEAEADLIVMTGHVAQIIADDRSWRATLAAVHRALRPGGRVAFESRNPRAREWTTWTPEQSRRRLEHPELGPVEVWLEVTEVRGDLVASQIHYRFPSGEELRSGNELRFRSQAELTRSLTDAGFAVEHLFGDWDRRPVAADRPELIFVAARGGAAGPRLVPPTTLVRDSYLRGETELALEEGVATGWLAEAAADFAGFVERRRAVRVIWEVPVTELWFVDGSEYLGTVVIRHRLTPDLERVGGHVGYHVVPRHRRRGHATRMLGQAKRVCADLGLAEILVTCREDNVASRRVIEANGGAFRGVVAGEAHYVLSTTGNGS